MTRAELIVQGEALLTDIAKEFGMTQEVTQIKHATLYTLSYAIPPATRIEFVVRLKRKAKTTELAEFFGRAGIELRRGVEEAAYRARMAAS